MCMIFCMKIFEIMFLNILKDFLILLWIKLIIIIRFLEDFVCIFNIFGVIFYNI